MPAAEVALGSEVVRALLREQHADLAELPLSEIGSGWDNTLYRLGDGLLVRLPRRAVAAALIAHEQRWLSALARRLPLPVPAPLRVGRPGCGFPWAWSIVPWLPGENALLAPADDPAIAARDLGAFLHALHAPAPDDAPCNPLRGVALAERTAAVHDAVSRLGRLIDRARVLAAWEEFLRVPPWPGPPLWVHGDLHPGNLLVSGGRLSAVIDFGDLTAGDPATDLAIAWMLLPASGRSIFRRAAAGGTGCIDLDTWTRARGWALALGLVYLASSADAPSMGALGRRTIEAVLSEF